MMENKSKWKMEDIKKIQTATTNREICFEFGFINEPDDNLTIRKLRATLDELLNPANRKSIEYQELSAEYNLFYKRQYMNIDDNNGGIFEGDIVKLTERTIVNNKVYRETFNEGVVYNDCGFAAILLDDGKWVKISELGDSGYFLKDFTDVYIESIGNIWDADHRLKYLNLK